MQQAIRYQVITKVPDFSGRTLGVKFDMGNAYFDDVTIKRTELGRSAEQIAKQMEQDFGYTVLRLNMDGTPFHGVVEETNQGDSETESLSAESTANAEKRKKKK